MKFNLEKINKDIFNSTKTIDELFSVSDDKNDNNQKYKEYEEIEYPILLKKVTDTHGAYWVAEHSDLPGCITHGDTKEKALLNLEDAKKSWIYARLTDNESVPQPDSRKEIEECSGRILLRVPKELHYKLLQKAKEDDTSLNQELVFLISGALGETSSNNINEIKLLEQIQDIKEMLLEQKLEQNKTLEEIWKLNVSKTKSQPSNWDVLDKFSHYQSGRFVFKNAKKDKFKDQPHLDLSLLPFMYE